MVYERGGAIDEILYGYMIDALDNLSTNKNDCAETVLYCI